jgi:hypothetical protein
MDRSPADLPFERTFTSEYQMYLTKDDLAKGYKSWATKFDIVRQPQLLLHSNVANLHALEFLVFDKLGSRFLESS